MGKELGGNVMRYFFKHTKALAEKSIVVRIV